MKTLTFSNGDQMPIVGLGTWNSAPGEVYGAVMEAIRIGYRHIDRASICGNEAEVGNALRDAIGEGQVTRKELWIAAHHGCTPAQILIDGAFWTIEGSPWTLQTLWDADAAAR